LVRYHDNFDAALLNVKDRIGDLSLREDDLILAINRYRFSRPNFGEKRQRVKGLLMRLIAMSWPVEGARRSYYTPPPFQIERQNGVKWGGTRIEGAL
jgi:hypothetical protein